MRYVDLDDLDAPPRSLLDLSNPKTRKGSQERGYLVAILHLAPHTVSGVMNTCSHATAGCGASCLYFSGRGQDPAVRAARIRRTRYFFRRRQAFMEDLVDELIRLDALAHRRDLLLAVRLNAMSDIPWERIRIGGHRNVMAMFPTVQFYDYTKRPDRIDQVPDNYALTFSLSEENDADARRYLQHGRNVAVVFARTPPAEWWGYTVIDGDEHDLRFLDPPGVIVGLHAKGPAVKDTSGFVIR